MIGIVNIVKMSDLPRFTYRLSAIPKRIPADLLNIEIDKFMWKAREQKKNKGGGLTPVNFKTHYRTIGIKTVSYLYAVRSTDQ